MDLLDEGILHKMVLAGVSATICCRDAEVSANMVDSWQPTLHSLKWAVKREGGAVLFPFRTGHSLLCISSYTNCSANLMVETSWEVSSSNRKYFLSDS